jgi:hypothetical protein
MRTPVARLQQLRGDVTERHDDKQPGRGALDPGEARILRPGRLRQRGDARRNGRLHAG